MPGGWEDHRRSGVALAMRHRLQWFIHLRAHGLRKGDEHPAYTLHSTLLACWCPGGQKSCIHRSACSNTPRTTNRRPAIWTLQWQSVMDARDWLAFKLQRTLFLLTRTSAGLSSTCRHKKSTRRRVNSPPTKSSRRILKCWSLASSQYALSTK